MDFKNDFQLDGLAFSGIQMETLGAFKTRIIQPPVMHSISESRLRYADAEKLASQITLAPSCRYHAVVNGSFNFGDFIEALIVNHRLKINTLTISTLSLSQNNVDSLAGMLREGRIGQLNLIVSAYFYGHERSALIPYIYKKLDTAANNFQLAVADSHCKTSIFETHAGNKVVIHGSANLRSSGNLEQFCLEENKELYDFHNEYSTAILARYKTINHEVDPSEGDTVKMLRGNDLWATVNKPLNF